MLIVLSFITQQTPFFFVLNKLSGMYVVRQRIILKMCWQLSQCLWNTIKSWQTCAMWHVKTQVPNAGQE